MSNPTGMLGKYQIIREIARSNDIVYEAYDPVMNRRVALKEMALSKGSSPQQKEDRVKRFLREARAAGTLSHPNIMTVYEAGEADGRHYIAMEYLEGHTLRNEIDSRGFLPPDEAFRIAEAVLEALDYAHAKGVIHRDIKPENIQMLPDGRIKLTDFGIARLTFEPNLTIDGQVFGTPSYMSPEQVVGRDIDVRSDLFSLGVVFYEMLSGQKPFTGDSVVTITYAIVNKEAVRPTQANHAVWQFLSRSLEKSVALRYPSASDMLTALRSAKNAVSADGFLVGQGAPPVVAPPPPMFQVGTSSVPANPGYSTQPYVPGVPVPLQTPYNPYQSGSQPANTQVPVYYPPPPRTPLFKPETKLFMAKLLLTLVVMGTLMALIIVTVTSLGKVMERWRMQQEDAERLARIERNMPTDPSSVDQRIEVKERAVGQLTSDVSRAEQRRRVAEDYRVRALNEIQNGRWAEAEASLTKARENAPGEAQYLADIGWLYLNRARSSRNDTERLTMLREAQTRYQEAVRVASNARVREFCVQGMEEVGRSMVGVADGHLAQGDSQGALALLYDARALASPGGELRRQIDERLASLGR